MITHSRRYQRKWPSYRCCSVNYVQRIYCFRLQEDSAIKSMGISLAFGVLFDAFIVRMTLIPALTKLFGKALGTFLVR